MHQNELNPPPVEEESPKNNVYKPRVIAIRGWFEEDAPPLKFLIPGFLQGDVGGLIAPGATGKSFLCLELAFAICGARDILKIAPQTTGKVVYFCAEDQEVVVRNRIKAMCNFFSPDDREKIYKNFVLVDCRGEDNDIMNQECVDFYIKQGQNAKLLIFDTLSRLHDLEENDNGQMAKIIRQFEKISKSTGASSLFAHHTGKAATREGIADAQSARGADSLVANSRFIANMRKMSEKEAKDNGIDKENRDFYVTYLVTKQNFSAPEPAKWLKRENGVLVTWAPNQPYSKTTQATPSLAHNNKIVQETLGVPEGMEETVEGSWFR